MAEDLPRQGTSRPVDTPDEIATYKASQLHEYGMWVAAVDIFAGNALAYRKGDPVPTSNVEAHGYDKNRLDRKSVV